MYLNTRWFWPTLWPSVWDHPLFNQQVASSSMKYSENDEGIIYQISVPETVDEALIEASVKDGILTLKLPTRVEPPREDEGSKLKVKFK